MLAARLYGPGDLRVETVPEPTPGPGEVVIRVRAAAVCGTDARALRSGLRGVSADSPRILGHELAGEIAAVGPGVEGLTEGQRVGVAPNIGCGHCSFCAAGRVHMCQSLHAVGLQIDGGFAENVKIPAVAVAQGNVVALPEQVSLAEGAIVEPLACCYNTFEVLAPRPGESVMIYGGGPIGLLHLLLARLVSPGVVLLADPRPERRAAARELGAEVVLDPDAPGFTGMVAEATGGRGPDVTITACPSPQAQRDALQHAAVFGRISFFGGLPRGESIVDLDTNAVHYRQLTVTGTTACSTWHYLKALDLVSSGRLDLRPFLANRYPLAEAQQGMADSMAGRVLKSILEP